MLIIPRKCRQIVSLAALAGPSTGTLRRADFWKSKIFDKYSSHTILHVLLV